MFISFVSLVPKAFDEKVLFLMREKLSWTRPKRAYLLMWRAVALLMM
jgi:hypothetical protein